MVSLQYIDMVSVVPFADPCWIVGYIFFSLHLFTALRFVRRDQIHAFSVIMVVIASGSIIAYNLILPSGSFAKGEGRIIGEIRTGFIDLVLSILYPILDLVLIIPSVIIDGSQERLPYHSGWSFLLVQQILQYLENGKISS
jgi:hypothetical protein